MDVTQRDAVEGAIAAAREELGASPNLLVNLAGILRFRPFENVKEDQLSAISDVNLKVRYCLVLALLVN